MKRRVLPAIVMAIGMAALGAAEQARFDDIVRNLRNPEPRARLNAVRLLRHAKHPEAIVPLAPLVNDPLDAIQLEAIAAELSFFLVEDLPQRRRLGFVEVRNRGNAAAAFELGPLAVWPRHAPPELISALLRAVDDDTPRVRVEAIYAAGTIARPPLPAQSEQQLVQALDHYDPAIRAAAARVAGRLRTTAAFDMLMRALGDSSADVRNAAMRALGLIGDERAVNALADQLKFYGKGEGAWSALDALARIAHASSLPLFASRLTDRDQNIRRTAVEGLGRGGDKSAISQLEAAASDSSTMVRAAAYYALEKLGRPSVARLIDVLGEERVAPQVQEYLIELGPGIEQELHQGLQHLDDGVRAAVADVLGEIGTDASLAALRELKDRDRDVVEAATRAVERIRMRRAL